MLIGFDIELDEYCLYIASDDAIIILVANRAIYLYKFLFLERDLATDLSLYNNHRYLLSQSLLLLSVSVLPCRRVFEVEFAFEHSTLTFKRSKVTLKAFDVTLQGCLLHALSLFDSNSLSIYRSLPH